MSSDVNYDTMATDLLNAGMGDVGRLQFILECIKNKKPLYNTDEKYLRLKYMEFETKLEILSGGKKSKTLVSENDLNGIIDSIVDKAISKERQTEKYIIPSKKESFLKRLFGKE